MREFSKVFSMMIELLSTRLSNGCTTTQNYSATALTIYLAIDSQTAVEAKMRIERGSESTCRISQAFLHEKRVNSHPQQPHIELKWSPKRDHFTIAPATLFSICKELQGSDCVLTREEFDKKSQKRSNRRTWKTFRKLQV